MWNAADVKQIIPGSHNDIPHIDLKQFVLLFEINRVWCSRAENLACFTFAPLKVNAVFRVNDWVFGNSLWERTIDHFAFAQAGLEHVVDDFKGAFLDTNTTASACLLVYVTCLFAHCYSKVAQVAGNIFNLTPGKQGDVGVLAHFHHLRGQNAGRAVQRWECFIQLGHMATDRRFTFHQVDVEATVG